MANLPCESLIQREGTSKVNKEIINMLETFESHPPKGQIIAITNVKGGSGRSFVTVCLAVALAETGVPVMVLDFSSHFAAAMKAFEKRQKFFNSSLSITIKMVSSLEEIEKLALPFSSKEGYVIFDLPPIRSCLHLIGLAMADQMLFVTRSDGEFRMWEDRTRDMVLLSRNLEVPSMEVEFPRKPCWCMITDFRPTRRSISLRSAMQSDSILTWLGELTYNNRFAGWIADGVAPWERSHTDLAQKWKRFWDPIINYTT